MRHTAANARSDEENSMPPERGFPAESRTDGEWSDGEIIAAVRAGEIGQFEKIVRRYRRNLLATAFARLGDMASAEDAVQEAFLSAYRSLNLYDSRFRFRSWLWSILINQCRREYRRRKNYGTQPGSREIHAATQHADEPRDEKSKAPDNQLIHDEHLRLVCQLMERLPTEQADAIQLRFFGEMKYEEIANAMQCGLTTAKNRVRVGLEKLNHLLQANGHDA